MNRISGFLLTSFLHLFFLFLPLHAQEIAAPNDTASGNEPSHITPWSSSGIEHLIGLPEVKAKEKGVLAVNATELSFSGKTGRAAIPIRSLLAVSTDNQRVELWGTKGRILRMVIPNGGGLAAATVMHHRIDLLTVEFRDDRGAYHGAVFVLPAHEADHVVQSFASMPSLTKAPVNHHEEALNASCHEGNVRPGSVFVAAPEWDKVAVPASYRALVYERLIDRLRKAKGVERVYRDHENGIAPGCTQYAIHLSITGFKPGNQVQRSWSGPVGMFVGTTQMVFDSTITDASGKPGSHEQIKASARGDSENTTVANGVAKKLVHQFTETQKNGK